MKAKFHVTVVIISLMLMFCSQRPAPVQTSQSTKATPPVPVPEPIDSFQPVKTLLGRICAPCHNPGGKMYERLPFDQPEVIRSNQQGILGRLSAQDKLVLEQWLKEGS